MTPIIDNEYIKSYEKYINFMKVLITTNISGKQLKGWNTSINKRKSEDIKRTLNIIKNNKNKNISSLKDYLFWNITASSNKGVFDILQILYLSLNNITIFIFKVLENCKKNLNKFSNKTELSDDEIDKLRILIIQPLYLIIWFYKYMSTGVCYLLSFVKTNKSRFFQDIIDYFVKNKTKGLFNVFTETLIQSYFDIFNSFFNENKELIINLINNNNSNNSDESSNDDKFDELITLLKNSINELKSVSFYQKKLNFGKEIDGFCTINIIKKKKTYSVKGKSETASYIKLCIEIFNSSNSDNENEEDSDNNDDNKPITNNELPKPLRNKNLNFNKNELTSFDLQVLRWLDNELNKKESNTFSQWDFDESNIIPDIIFLKNKLLFEDNITTISSGNTNTINTNTNSNSSNNNTSNSNTSNKNKSNKQNKGKKIKLKYINDTILSNMTSLGRCLALYLVAEHIFKQDIIVQVDKNNKNTKDLLFFEIEKVSLSNKSTKVNFKFTNKQTKQYAVFRVLPQKKYGSSIGQVSYYDCIVRIINDDDRNHEQDGLSVSKKTVSSTGLHSLSYFINHYLKERTLPFKKEILDKIRDKLVN